ncbi:MAG: CPBP family glutamic-type intramembrane protease [Desulfobacterales bacterium]|nr:CPBP family glutamic-type intramembrane protease [Desulfobacterales bacterium]
MANDPSHPKSYETYLKNSSPAELRQIVAAIDRERFPDRYALARTYLARSELSAEGRDPTWEVLKPSNLAMPADPREPGLPWIYLMIPAGVFALYYGGGRFLFEWEAVAFRPWLVMPLLILVTIVFEGCSLGVALTAGRYLGLRPFFRGRTLKSAIWEFLFSLGMVIPVNIGITLVMVMATAVLDTPVTPHSLIRYINHAPNSSAIIFWLVMAFTILPVIEEIIFRGYVFGFLKTRMSVPAACTGQAFLFAVCHPYGIAGNCGIFVLGVVLGVVCEKRGGLLCPVFIHCLKNGLVSVPFIIMAVSNFHHPAHNLNQAMSRPHWLADAPPAWVEKQESAGAQLTWAEDTWGKKAWKKSANALTAVEHWYPDDRDASRKAALKLASIYYYRLGDYWRTVVAADTLLKTYGPDSEEAGTALSLKAWSYYMLKRFDLSRSFFEQLRVEYPENETLLAAAEKGLKMLDRIAPVVHKGG